MSNSNMSKAEEAIELLKLQAAHDMWKQQHEARQQMEELEALLAKLQLESEERQEKAKKASEPEVPKASPEEAKQKTSVFLDTLELLQKETRVGFYAEVHASDPTTGKTTSTGYRWNDWKDFCRRSEYTPQDIREVGSTIGFDVYEGDFLPLEAVIQHLPKPEFAQRLV